MSEAKKYYVVKTLIRQRSPEDFATIGHAFDGNERMGYIPVFDDLEKLKKAYPNIAFVELENLQDITELHKKLE